MQQIHINKLYKQINNTFNLNVESLNLEAGKVYGLIGPNGAGKTTIMKCLCGLLRPEYGQIEMDDKLIDVQNIDLLNTIGTNFINMDSLKGVSLDDIYQDHIFYYGLRQSKSINELLRDVDLNVGGATLFNTMSLGMKQRFLLGLSTLHDPSLILLDEPFNGLDPDGVDLFIAHVKSLSENRVIVISSHVLRDMETFLDEVIFIENGNIMKTTSMSDIRGDYKDGLKDYYDEQKQKKY